MTNPIAVSQRAREFAAQSYEDIAGCTIPLRFPARVRAGENSDLVQAFARFEAEIRADERAKCVKDASRHISRSVGAAIRNQKDHDHG